LTIRRVLAVLGLVVLAALGYLGARAYTVYREVQTVVQPVPRSTYEPTLGPLPVPADTSLFAQKRRINILVLGSDNDQKSEERNPPTQSMIVVSVDPVHHKVWLLSIPRDFWVPVRGHGMQKIMLAYKFGRVQLARETVQRLFNIYIDAYAWIGLNGFIHVIDTFGGVTVDVQHPILDDSYPNDLSTPNSYAFQRIFIPPGWQHLKGDLALKYVRSRHGAYLGDFDRSARQQEVLLALKSKANGLGLIQNIPALIDDMHGFVRTDLNLTDLPGLLDMAQVARAVKRSDVRQVVLQAPTYARETIVNGQDVVIPNWAKIRPVLHQIFAPNQPSAAHHTPTAAPHPSLIKTRSPATPTPHKTPVHKAPTPTPTPVPVGPFHPRGTLLYVNQWNSNLYQWRPGAGLTPLTSTGDVAMPSISPDGRTIALVRFPRYRDVSDIWMLDSRTHHLHQLTNGQAGNGKDVRNNLWAAWPAWSSDGSRLLFSWDQQKRTQPPSDIRAAGPAVWSWPLHGGNPVPLTVPVAGSGGDEDPAVRPHSQSFLYVKWNYFPQTFGIYSQLMLDNPVNGTQTALTPVGGRILQPTWDASGTRVAFVRGVANANELVVAHVVDTPQGPQLRQITVVARGAVGQPSFTRDGRWISFLRPQGDAFSLFVVPATGGGEQQISAIPNVIDGRWRPVWTG